MGPLDFTRCALLMINKTKEDVLCNEGGLSICLLSLLKNFMKGIVCLKDKEVFMKLNLLRCFSYYSVYVQVYMYNCEGYKSTKIRVLTQKHSCAIINWSQYSSVLLQRVGNGPLHCSALELFGVINFKLDCELHPICTSFRVYRGCPIPFCSLPLKRSRWDKAPLTFQYMTLSCFLSFAKVGPYCSF